METIEESVYSKEKSDFYTLYNDFYQKLVNYQEETMDVENAEDTISAYCLYNILKNYYQDLEDIMNCSSQVIKDLLLDINRFIVLGDTCTKLRKSSIMPKNIFNLIIKLQEQNNLKTSNKKYNGVKFYIGSNATYAMFDVVIDGKYKKVIVCRDLINHDLYYGRDSIVDNQVIDYIYNRLIDIFNLIDNYRPSLPEDLDFDFYTEVEACRPYEYNEYVIPFNNELLKGEISINTNGCVNFKTQIIESEDPFGLYTRLDSYAKDLHEVFNKDDIESLKKMPVNINDLEEPIKDIVINYLYDNKSKEIAM